MNWALKRHPAFKGVDGPVVVCVMDGVGIGRQDASDAVWLARTPTLDALAAQVPTTALQAHGLAVGMPSEADMGNSEVGHNALGAGRIFDQGASLVAEALASGRIFDGAAWKSALARVRTSGQPLHFLGLLSDGNVHSHIEHLFALLRRCDHEEITRVRVHVLLDGRDVAENSALDYVDALEELLETISRSSNRDYQIASGGGRMVITMDRYEAEWGMVERGWQTHVAAQAQIFPCARVAIQTLRDEHPGISDQNLPPFAIGPEGGQPIGPIQDGSSVILFNFRGDRAMEISRAFEDETFPFFDRGHRPDVFFAGMMQYDGDLQIPKHYLVEPPDIDRTLGEYLARNGVPQFAISETQKYGHVTYFWNGNRSGLFDESLETYVEIPSDTLPFEERPWMKAAEITDRLIQELESGRSRHARFNLANGDMVGHTGHLDASVQAVEAVDLQIARILRTIERTRGALIVTADHGNADGMFDINPQTGEPAEGADGRIRPKTSHTLNPVPFHVFAPGQALDIEKSIRKPGLANVAATVLHLLGYEAPEGYAPTLLKNA